MKKYILSFALVIGICLSSFASPVVPPDCGCGDPKAKTVLTPDSELTPEELKIKKIILANPKLNKPGVSFKSTESSTTIQGPCSISGYNTQTTQIQKDWALALKVATEATGWYCACRKKEVRMHGSDENPSAYTICVSVIIMHITECSCLDEEP